MNTRLLERYRDRIAGVLTCYDRIVITGTLPGACHHAGMTGFLNAHQIRIFDYPRCAEPLRERIRGCAEKLAEAADARIEYIAKAHNRKEAVVAAVIRRAGMIPGWCMSFRPWKPARPTSRGPVDAVPRHGGRCTRQCCCTHLLSSRKDGSVNSLVKRGHKEVCPLSRGVMLQPLSIRLQNGVRFLLVPVPAPPWANLAACCLPKASDTGFPRSTCTSTSA